MTYPIALDLTGRRCVMVGGGQIAARKVRDLLAAGAAVTVISPALDLALAAYAAQAAITWREDVYRAGMIAELNPLLVFAATDSADVNRMVAEEARACGCLANVVDGSASCDFGNMAVIRRDPITVALSTGGVSPAMLAYLKGVLSGVIGEEYATLARWLADLRPVIESRMPDQTARRDLYRAIIDSDALYHLRQGDDDTARAVVDAVVESIIGATAP